MADDKTFSERLRDFPALKLGVIILFGLILLQVFAMLLANVYPPAGNFKIGPIFTLLLVLIAIGLPAVIVRRYFQRDRPGEAFNRSDFLFIVIGAAILMVLIFYLPKIVPQVFSVAELFSLVNP